MNRRLVLVLVLVLVALIACADPVLPEPTGGGGAGAGTGGQAGHGGDGGAGNELRITFVPLELDTVVDKVTDMAFVPGRDELVILEKEGRVLHFDFDGTQATLRGSFELPVYVEDDCGLISVAFPPDFPLTGEMYLGYCADFTSSQVSRFVLDEPHEDILASEEAIIVLDEPLAAHPWHNVGSIGFEPSGVLWALFGEKTRGANSQDLSVDLGKLLRIVPKAGEPGFDPAPDNPFIDDPEKSPNVYAYGMRSPWKGVRDSKGRFWFGDVGSNLFEEINFVPEPGMNFGWDVHEGPCDSSLMDGCTEPVTYWDREFEHPYPADDPDAIPAGTRVVCVGPHIEPVVDDPYGGKLDGLTFFGDFVIGWIRALRIDDAGVVTFDQHIGHLPHASAWARGHDGRVFVMTYGPLAAMDPATLHVLRVD